MVGKGEGLTGKLREAHSFFPLLPFKTAAGTGVLLLMAESAQAADYLPVCCVYALCVCVFICWVCTLFGCWLHVSKDFVVCNYGGNKTHGSKFARNDKNRHLNAHMVFAKERLWECLCKTQHAVVAVYTMRIRLCLKGHGQKYKSVCCLRRQSLWQETEGSCLWVVLIVQLLTPSSSTLLHHTHKRAHVHKIELILLLGCRPKTCTHQREVCVLISCLALNTLSLHNTATVSN